MTDVEAIVLAGGQATRLGGARKPLLEIGGLTILERVLGAVRAVPVARVVLVANDRAWPMASDVTVVLDPQPHAGVLPALLAGLEAATASLCLSAAADMPFLSAPLYRLLLAHSAEADVVIPNVAGRREPMCAVYRRAPCREAIRATLATGQRRMVDFLDLVRVQEVDESLLRQADPELRAFFNVNTAADLAQARVLAAAATLQPPQ